jgi:hypothetical protein
MSRALLRDWAELAEEQRWRVVNKPGGKWVFYPPKGTVPPDLTVLNITEPLHEGNRSYDNIRALLKRAGLKFHEDIERERKRNAGFERISRDESNSRSEQKMTQSSQPPSTAKPTTFAAVREKITLIFNLASEVEQDLKKLETENIEMRTDSQTVAEALARMMARK